MKLAFRAVSFVVIITGAFIASKSVFTSRVDIAIVVVFISTLVDVLAKRSVASEAVVTSAGVSAVGISALSVGIASSIDGTFIDVLAELAVAAESFFTFTLITAYRVETPGISRALCFASSAPSSEEKIHHDLHRDGFEVGSFAFVDIIANLPVASEAGVTGASETSICVGTRSIGVAWIVKTLVNVFTFAEFAIVLEAFLAKAVERTDRVDTR